MKLKNIIYKITLIIFNQTSLSRRLEQDKKVRQNQILELIKIFEQVQYKSILHNNFLISLNRQLSIFHRIVKKIIFNQNKIKWYQRTIYQIGSIIRNMIPLELMALYMSKLNEITIQTFLESNNRQFPYKNISYIYKHREQLWIKILLKIYKERSRNQLIIQKSIHKKSMFEVENYNCLDQNKSTDLMVTQIKSEIIQKQTESLQTKSTIFFHQMNPYHNLKNSQIIVSNIIKSKENFFEQNDFPNIQELQINQIIQNNQQENQFANSLLNQEFLIDEPKDALKQNAQIRILDSQIQEEEQKYYDNECSFQVQESNLILSKNKNEIFEDQVNDQLAEFATQIQQYQSNHNQSLNNETQNISIHQFEQQIY
ncbi:unnamed protein product [Paramecium pentaurelia]|uniref:Uncharacterized protein n=1 Tax=Paramecium pentaurelia TaxID=43138 RepID=A0A8S1V9W5_9CILI|nr:unnamed protein product [Paramecium pentaurelia]